MAMVGDAPTKTAIAPKNREIEAMAEDNNAAKGNGASPTLNILAQYVKDLSFEGGAPNSLRARDKRRTSISGSTSRQSAVGERVRRGADAERQG
jgi:hypothetical protein